MKKILLLLTLFWFINTVNATQYYISTTGSDAASGLVGFPKKTLQSVITTYILVSGDVINVAAGTYTTESNITLGATDVSFSIIGAGMNTTIFDFDQSNRFMTFAAANDGISISKLTIKDYKKGSDGGAILMSSGSNNITFTSITFDNCDVTGKGGSVYLDGNIVTFSKCTFKNCDATLYGGAISAYNATCTITISKCIFFSNTGTYGSAIEIEGTSSSLTVTNSLFYENVCGTVGTIGWDKGTTATITNCTVTYNTGPYPGIVQWDLTSANPTSTMKNVISYNNTGSTNCDFYENGGRMNLTNCLSTSTNTSSSRISISGTVTSCIVGSPSYTNIATDDYTLLVSSSCIDAGVSVGSGGMVDDLNSFTRINNPDIGAFESTTVPLPIELLFFRGEGLEHYNRLYWSTASETNNDYFDILKTIDGVYYYNIVTINGAGNSVNEINYSYDDMERIDTISYYVLKQTDFDGKFKYSDIISIDNRKSSGPILVKVTNLLGEEVSNEYRGVLLFVYSDGSVIKRFFYN